MADGLLLVLFGLVAFLLVCHVLYDPDLFWHVRSGAWILEQGRPPQTDPFSFGSQGRPWIDLHWGYQVVLCLLFRAGGAKALIVLGAAYVAVATAVALAARPRSARLPLALLCWAPALVLVSARNQPRPEIFTLVFLSVYLAVLAHLDRHPRLAWLLPGVQVLWVNVHSLFVLGPAVLAMWLLARAGRWAWERLAVRASTAAPPARGRWHIVAASLAVLVACLLNPYGVRGALYPLILYPKVTEEGNLYKENVGEFFSPRRVATMIEPGKVGNNWYFCAFAFLVLLVPLSFVLPALWQASRSRSPEPDGEGLAGGAVGRSSWPWLGILAGTVALLILRTATLSPQGRPAWLLALGGWVPALFVAAGAAGALILGRRSAVAGGLALCAGCGLAAWMGWLYDYLLFGPARADTGSGSAAVVLLVVAVLSGVVAVPLLLRAGASPFGLALAGAFGYLALSAVYNWSRLGLVAGILLCLNLGPWVTCLLPVPPGGRWLGWGGRLGMGFLLSAWACAILTGAYPRWVGSDFGFGEQRLVFPHDAARFAGQSDMPARAVVLPLEGAGLYIYHAAPGHKHFMDTRLELPAPETFRRYLSVWTGLNEGDPHAVAALEALDAPVVQVGHDNDAQAEAALLLDPGWRLVYFDALAAVFLARTDSHLEARFPTLDLGGRHFAQPRPRSLPAVSGAAGKEARALLDLGLALRRDPAARWRLHIPVLLAALDRGEAAADEEPGQAANWFLLGSCHWSLLPELRGPPRPALQGWDPDTGLAWAQATYCFRRGLDCDPDNVPLLRALFRSYDARELSDAEGEVAGRLRALEDPSLQADRGRRPGGSEFGAARYPPPHLPVVVAELLDSRQPAAAAGLAEQALARGEADWDWPLADRLAGVCLHLGRPALARELWQRAKGPPAEAVRHSRLGDACWVERNFEAAIHHYQEARRLDPRLVEPCWALAWLYAELGQAGPALAACRDGLSLQLPADRRDELRALEELLRRNTSADAQAAVLTGRPGAAAGARW